jgi:spore coat protein H
MMLLSSQWRNRCRLCASLALVILLSSVALGKPGATKAKKAGKGNHPQPTEDIFTNTQVLRIQIEIPDEAMKILRGYRWEGFGGGVQDKRPSVKATVREGDKVYTDVAVHLKGAAGSFRSIDSNPALTFNFDKHVKGQTFHGLERISLNNSVQDGSFLNEQISRELFASVGVAVPRATEATVELNGRDLGMHVLVEAANKQFLARWFKNPNGNLYDGGFLKDITDPLEKSSGDKPNDRSDLEHLADAATDTNSTNRLKRMEKLMDVDRFITYLALDVMMCDWDGYALNRNNYRIYHDPASDKIYFIPHGLDQMFGVMRAGTDMPIYPRWSGLVARGLLQTAEGRKRYRERIAELMTTVYQVESITNRVWQLAAKLRPVLAEKGPNAARSHEREVKDFCDRIVNRARSIREQLAAPDQALKFDSAGLARLPSWVSRTESGKPVLEESVEGGKKLLHISARNGSCVGVWFTRVRLEPGHYRLEGKARTQAVTTDPGDRKGGAGLRNSERRMIQKLTGDTGWTNIVFEFDVGDTSSQSGFMGMGPVQEEIPDLQLICELRAAKGEAWFDRDSLRLLRK